MRAMILAAGRGTRMGGLTKNVPKPLLRVGEHYLIEHSLFALRRAGIHEVVINISYLGEQIQTALGNGSEYDMYIAYSYEPERLETGGGIYQALALLGNEPFIVLSADVICDYDLKKLPRDPHGLAHLVLVNNPGYHLGGDFDLQDGYVVKGTTYTYANIGVYRPELFNEAVPGFFPLSDVLLPAAARQQVTGELYQGRWYNVGNAIELEAASIIS